VRALSAVWRPIYNSTETGTADTGTSLSGRTVRRIDDCRRTICSVSDGIRRAARYAACTLHSSIVNDDKVSVHLVGRCDYRLGGVANYVV
jgi:hypothetical protein